MTITAKIICDSISPNNVRLTTMQLRYPRFIHAEFMTHRQFSRNASSSRAVPVEKLIQDIIEDTAMPISWGKNQPGMQAGEEHDEEIKVTGYLPKYKKDQAWKMARDDAIKYAQAFHRAGYHKQIVNRLLEPFSHINVVVTSTEWSNFFALRIHPSAQPEIQQLARNMKLAMDMSEPVKLDYGCWHLPYVDYSSIMSSIKEEDVIKCSVARCARVSYMTYEMKKPTLEEDLKLYDRLLGAQPIHASPAEHQARPDKPVPNDCGYNTWEAAHLWGNFRGWIQYRKTLEGECQ